MNVLVEYWGEVVTSAAYLINHTSSWVIECQNPLQQLQKLLLIPSLPNLEPRVFGCTVYVHIPKQQQSKLDPRARKCIFVGYADFQKRYRCYDPLTDTMHVSLDVSFRESEPYYSGGVLESSLQGERAYEGNSQYLFEFEEFKELEALESRFGVGENKNHENDVVQQQTNTDKNSGPRVEIVVDGVQRVKQQQISSDAIECEPNRKPKGAEAEPQFQLGSRVCVDLVLGSEAVPRVVHREVDMTDEEERLSNWKRQARDLYKRISTMDNNQDDEFHADLIALLFGNEGDNQEVGVEEIPEAFEGVQENLEGFVQNPEGLGVEGVQVQENRVLCKIQRVWELKGITGSASPRKSRGFCVKSSRFSWTCTTCGFPSTPKPSSGFCTKPSRFSWGAADAEQAQGAEILSDLDKPVVVYNARDSHDDHAGTSKKRGRPRKYATPEEARAAKTEKQRQRRRLRRNPTVQGGEIPTDDADQEFVALLESVLEEVTESTVENKPSREIIDEELEEVTESTAENKPSREITDEDWTGRCRITSLRSSMTHTRSLKTGTMN
uniref:uncharacterized protein LOC101291945 n=1 Tax=Fragaria vesca subsp. vesca TaxID=101020 RepID=UPI0005C9E0C1|nr:PREDICTED: uncharacterized protein LOC101291945 [Fragaria vesca subsp. vesca]